LVAEIHLSDNGSLCWGKTAATCSLPHPENESQLSVNRFLLRILGNLCSFWLLTSVHEILAAFIGKNIGDMLPGSF